MPVVALPNPYTALTLRLRSFAEILTFVSAADGYLPGTSSVDRAKPRISSVRQKFWSLPHFAILVRKAGGPPPHRDSGLHTSRADLWLYGPGGPNNDPGTQEMEAFNLWCTVFPALMPPPGQSDMFTAAGCCVDGITSEAEPIPFIDQDTGWRVLVCPILVNWS